MSKRTKSSINARSIQLVLSEEVITTAVQRDSSHCVIADQLARTLPVQRVSVDLQTIRFTDPATGRRYVYFTPAIAQRILINFDQGHTPEAGTIIKLGKPCQVLNPPTDSEDSKTKRNTAQNRRRAAARIESESPRRGYPTKIDGNPPPLAVLAHNMRGRRRTFGVRLLDS